MFGSVFRVKVKPGSYDKLQEVIASWNRDRAPKAVGTQGSYALHSKDDPNEMWVMAIFDTEENYYKNANDPDQDAWFQKMRANLESDPEWHDGEITKTM